MIVCSAQIPSLPFLLEIPVTLDATGNAWDHLTPFMMSIADTYPGCAPPAELSDSLSDWSDSSEQDEETHEGFFNFLHTLAY